MYEIEKEPTMYDGDILNLEKLKQYYSIKENFRITQNFTFDDYPVDQNIMLFINNAKKLTEDELLELSIIV